MIATLEDFEAARNLSDADLRELVHSDDARTRLYAVWALGLRSASIVGHLHEEPDPGVRRAMAVVLAGQGEVDLLVALSRHDPNVYVRASTAQIVVRFAAAGRVPWSLVVERLADAAEVRAAVVSQLDATSPPELRERVLAALRDGEEIVRREAFDVALKLVAAGVATHEHLRDGLEHMSRAECTNALARWFALAEASVIAAVLVDASSSVRELAIRQRPELAFSDLLPLIAHDVELYEKVEHKLDELPLFVLAQFVLCEGSREYLVEHLVQRLSSARVLPAELAQLVGELRALCAGRLGALERELSRELDDDTCDDLEYSRETFVALAYELERFVARA